MWPLVFFSLYGIIFDAAEQGVTFLAHPVYQQHRTYFQMDERSWEYRLRLSSIARTIKFRHSLVLTRQQASISRNDSRMSKLESYISDTTHTQIKLNYRLRMWSATLTWWGAYAPRTRTICNLQERSLLRADRMIRTTILHVTSAKWLVNFRLHSRSLWPLVTSGLRIGPNWYGLSAGQV